MSCSVKGCHSHSGRKQSSLITFHRFPRNEQMKRQWIRSIILKPNWKWNNRKIVCSKHFAPLSFVTRDGDERWRRLKNDVIPTLFLGTDALATASHNSVSALSTTQKDTTDNTIDIKEEILTTTQLWTTDDSVDVKEEILTTTQGETYFTGDFEEEILTTTKRETIYDAVDVKEEIPTTTQRETIYYTDDFEEEIPTIRQVVTIETATQTHCVHLDELKSPSVATGCNTTGSRCKIALELQKELDRVKIVSQRRLRKINTLTKKISRLQESNDVIYDDLIQHLKNAQVVI